MKPIFPQTPFDSTIKKPQRLIWMRANCPNKIELSLSIQAALFGWASDFPMLGVTLQPHGILPISPKIQMASLDHTIYFHQPFPFNQWVLFDIHSPAGHGGRALSQAYCYSQQGQLLATCIQEGLVRIRS